jgi:hypothetical protein
VSTTQAINEKNFEPGWSYFVAILFHWDRSNGEYRFEREQTLSVTLKKIRR